MATIIQLNIIFFSLYVAWALFSRYWQQRTTIPTFSSIQKAKLIATGFIANIADTIGLGSFAVIVALNKHWRLINDELVPGTLNAQGTLPTLCQALFFLQVVQVEMTTLVTLIFSASVGGFLGGMVVANLDKTRIRSLMLIGYIGMATMILASKCGFLPIGGDLMALHGSALTIGAFAMLITGILPAIGVGAYAPTQVILFLLGMHPLAAFPIMTASAAFQQSVVALTFTRKGQLDLKSACILSLAGIAGVLLAAPMVTHINSASLRWLLLGVVSYNIAMLWKTQSPSSTVKSTVSFSSPK